MLGQRNESGWFAELTKPPPDGGLISVFCFSGLNVIISSVALLARASSFPLQITMKNPSFGDAWTVNSMEDDHTCSFLTCKTRSWLYELPLPLSWSEAVLRIRRHLAQQSLRKQHPDGKGHLRGTRKESGTNKDPSLLVKSLIPTDGDPPFCLENWLWVQISEYPHTLQQQPLIQLSTPVLASRSVLIESFSFIP
ncbi:hypothetical protein CB1_002332001 [Camelus ferus]|nr:hypothetical protein CB1_002332001 [Camelus ferus]